MAEEESLDAEAAAAYLGLPTRSVYAMVNPGQVPALRFPLRIRRQDPENCLERYRIRPRDWAHLDPNRHQAVRQSSATPYRQGHA